MLHLETYIYTLSFVLFLIFFIRIVKQKGSVFLKDKQKRMDDFFKTARYLQHVSLRYIMQEKDQDNTFQNTLRVIKTDAQQQIKKMEHDSYEEIEKQAQKLKLQFSSRVKIMNARFIHDAKEILIHSLIKEVMQSLKQ